MAAGLVALFRLLARLLTVLRARLRMWLQRESTRKPSRNARSSLQCGTLAKHRRKSSRRYGLRQRKGRGFIPLRMLLGMRALVSLVWRIAGRERRERALAARFSLGKRGRRGG